MLDFLSIFTNTNLLSFPNTGAVNASGGASTDGTEFIANMVNDSMWGWQQALLNSVGMSPSGVVESQSASQIVEALRKFTIPGIAMPVFWNNDPATLGIRAIMMSGQGILRVNYPDLDAVVYVGDADNPTAAAFYHADDAAGVTRNIAGNYLILPDGRGRVMRGLDLTGVVDLDGATRELGDEQEDAGQRITGEWQQQPNGSNSSGLIASSVLEGVFKLGTPTQAIINITAGSGFRIGFDSSLSTSPNPAKTTDDQTRSKNLAANYMITY